MTIVGLPDAVQESRERVRAAIRNSGFEFPMRRITVSLAPAHLRKEGPYYDFSIAIGILRSSVITQCTRSDGFTVRIAEEAGSDTVYVLSFGTTISKGMPDLSLLTKTKMMQKRGVCR